MYENGFGIKDPTIVYMPPNQTNQKERILPLNSQAVDVSE